MLSSQASSLSELWHILENTPLYKTPHFNSMCFHNELIREQHTPVNQVFALTSGLVLGQRPLLCLHSVERETKMQHICTVHAV